MQVQRRRLCPLRLQDISLEHYLLQEDPKNKTIDTVKFWVAVRRLTNANGDQCYKELADFALRSLSLPISNAVVERVFSVMAIVKTKLRNRMSFDMLVAIMRIRIHLKVLNECCINFQPTKSMLFSSSIMYTNIDTERLALTSTNSEDEFAFMAALHLIERHDMTEP